MSDVQLHDVILPETVLKICRYCGHPRGSHKNDSECQVIGCNCKQFSE
jgi:hypothetical protein